jgi:osmoprotectant transport system permease protein
VTWRRACFVALSRALGSVAVLAVALTLLSACRPRTTSPARLRIGSKRFTESYILAEIAAQATRTAGEAKPELSMGLGGTAIVFEALANGSIDVYPEYTGTIAEVVFHLPPGTSRDELARRLAQRGLAMSPPLGFSNTYALAVPATAPRTQAVRRISDLGRVAGLRIGLSPEFLGRRDGWPGLAQAYAFPTLAPRSVDHGLAYEALGRGDLDVVDVYATDAEIPRLGLRLLEDDRHFFPPYDAVFLYRTDAPARLPATFAALAALGGTLDARTMTSLNAQVDIDGATFAEAARSFFRQAGAVPALAVRAPWLVQLAHVVEDEGPRHLWLVFVSLALAIVCGVPLGILAYRRPRLGSAILGLTGVLQTVPSLALLCFMIPLFGIGAVPALAALFLYGLLPIVRSTAVGFADIPATVREVAAAIGLPARARLARHLRRDQDVGRDQRRDGNAGGLHRRRGVRRPDLDGAELERQQHHFAGSRPRGAPGHDHSRRLRRTRALRRPRGASPRCAARRTLIARA